MPEIVLVLGSICSAVATKYLSVVVAVPPLYKGNLDWTELWMMVLFGGWIDWLKDRSPPPRSDFLQLEGVFCREVLEVPEDCGVILDLVGNASWWGVRGVWEECASRH
uniref:Uncharacterized protein n=1 Tax=Cacopsylla melanoneura TaxID=428564 RepID=A0A8D8LLC9_9HEMI